MLKIKTLTIIVSFVFLAPNVASALQIQDFMSGSEDNGLTAQSYLVIDKQSGAVLLQKEPQKVWPPASLTKLVTALVVLDRNPKLLKSIAMAKTDEAGGARLATKAGVSYRVKDLFYAMLIASANNAANAMARSTGLSRNKFVKAMNNKARELGAENTVFVDPSGISEKNQTTAEDFAKIAASAFDKTEILKAVRLTQYTLRSTNNSRYVHRIKNTNKLLEDGSLEVVAGKTGYLDESRYNFTALVEDQFNQELILVLLGAENPESQFRETKQLAFLGGLAKSMISLSNWVLGTSTVPIINK